MLTLLSFAQISIPKKLPGLLLWGKDSNPIRIEVYIDLLCIDCALDFPTVEAVANHYNETDSISIRYHFWELTQHKWGYITARAVYALNDMNSTQTLQFLREFLQYDVQKQFYNSATVNETQPQILDRFLQLIVDTTGVDPTELRAHYDSSSADSQARTDFKFSHIKNLPGTPTVFINGAMSSLNEESSEEDWYKLIDDLLAK